MNCSKMEVEDGDDGDCDERNETGGQECCCVRRRDDGGRPEGDVDGKMRHCVCFTVINVLF